MKREIQRWSTPVKDARAANDVPWQEHERDFGLRYAIVTDLWFDPVKGETDSVSGQMIAIRWLRQGREVSRKSPHTRRGLAMQGWHYADRDEIAHWEAVRAAVETGEVVGIGKGRRGRAAPASRPL